ncbi:B12-binding domain-containing radical SAM protein [Omnitrophica bacterium]|nr:B12-binding domain-containing radical SAM protein [Candidatus Omnitrophota bacterium]
MKILLVNVPNHNEVTGSHPSFIVQERGVNPPLGLLYLAGYLQRYSAHEVTVIDSQVEELSYPQLRSRISEARPDVVGITAMTFTLVDVVKTIDIVKKIDKDIRVIIGGPHVYLYPEETIGFKNVDCLVLGEGERTFKELLDNIDDKERLKNIPGLVFKDGGNVVNTGYPPLIKDLDEIPFPARQLVPYKKYSSILAKEDAVSTIFTSRGCPFRCSFCARPHLGKLFRYQSARRVADELEECSKMGIRELLFYDDTFSVNKERVIEICSEIIKRRLDLKWDIRARVDTVNEEMLAHLKSAGCQGIHYGVEAGTEKILKILNKGITLDEVKKTFALTRKYKIPMLAYFMIGNPSETKEDILKTFAFARELNPDYVHTTILTPFPGTEIYLDGLKRGVIKKDYWKGFAKDPVPGFIAPHWDEIFTRKELTDLLLKGYKSFYLRPAYILKRVVSLQSFGEFKKKFTAGLKVFLTR